MDEHMEMQLFNWCLEEGLSLGRPVSRKMIKQKALELSQHPNKFKASKGWTDKFVKKFNLRKRVVKELQSMGRYRKQRIVNLKDEMSIKVQTKEESMDQFMIKDEKLPLSYGSSQIKTELCQEEFYCQSFNLFSEQRERLFMEDNTQ